VGRRVLRTESKPLPCPTTDLKASAKRNFSICLLLILLAFGVYKATVLFGAMPVPSPDYSGYVHVGREILHFQNPSTYKRPPVLGIMQIAASKLMLFSDNPVLTGSWLLNAIFGTMIGILAWLLAREVIGDSAVWFAIVFMLNPWILQFQANPIAELPMVFFILVTLFSIFKHSNWCYVFASLASMLRYECSALIFIAFLMDMVYRKSKKERLFAFLYAFCASVPFLLWMLGTAINWESSSGSHYLNLYGRENESMCFVKFFRLLWYSSFSTTHQWPAAVKAMFVGPASRAEAEAVTSAIRTVSMVSMITASTSCVIAVVMGIIRRNWNLLAMFLFLGLYIVAHSLKFDTHARYTVPVICLTFLLCWAGFQYTWRLINGAVRIPRSIIVVLQLVIFALAVVWFFAYIPYVSKTRPISVRLSWLPYAAVGTVIAVLLLHLYILKFKSCMRHFVLAAIVCLMITSQYFAAARAVGNGGYNVEFKHLADWYIANAKSGERLACTWVGLLKLMAEKHQADFIDLKTCRANTFDGIVRKCYKKNITYVAWTVRGSPKVKRGLKEIYVLREPRDIGPFEFIHRIDLGKKGRWINIFRLRPPADEGNEAGIEQERFAEP
jgi:hypothetical protein